jgi:hypothetical protein
MVCSDTYHWNFKLNAVAKALNKQTNDSSEKESKED